MNECLKIAILFFVEIFNENNLKKNISTGNGRDNSIE